VLSFRLISYLRRVGVHQSVAELGLLVLQYNVRIFKGYFQDSGHHDAARQQCFKEIKHNRSDYE
jgi:hypothetical protein